MKKIKDKICVECGDPFTPFMTTDKVCGVPCAIAKAVKDGEKKREREANQRGKESRKQTREAKVKARTHSQWLQILQPLVNHVARLIDNTKPCISCNRTTGKPQGGHYHASGGNHTLTFNLHNIHLQDYHCNMKKHANKTGYNLGMIERYGKAYQEYVEYKLRRIYPFIKLTIPELEECISRTKRIIKELQAIGGVYSPLQAYELREKYNAEIGIYTKSRQSEN